VFNKSSGTRVLIILIPMEKFIEKRSLACCIKRGSERSHGERKTLKKPRFSNQVSKHRS